MTRINRILLTVGLGIALPVLSFAQSSQDELIVLRKHLELPESTKIVVADAPIPATVNLYLGFGLDTGVRLNFNRWVEQWNKKESAKYGAIQIVDSAQSASIILARYVLLKEPTSETSGAVFANSQIATGHLDTTTLVPVYGYILIPTQSQLAIVWRYTQKTTIGETSESGRQLKDDLFKLLKKRNRN